MQHTKITTQASTQDFIRTALDDQTEDFIHPTTGETMRILQSTVHDSTADFRAEFRLPAGAQGPPLHFHGRYDEKFCVVEGTLRMRMGVTERDIRPGDSVEVPRGTVHAFENVSEDPVIFRVRASPGRDFEAFIRAWYRLGAEGLTGSSGVPFNPLHLAAALTWGNVILAGPLSWLLRHIIKGLAWLALVSGTDRVLRRSLPWERDFADGHLGQDGNE